MRGTSRIAGCSINTVTKLLEDVGAVCAAYQDKHLRALPCKRVQVDEMWSFINSRRDKSCETWLWIAMCSDTKLVTNWRVGDRTAKDAEIFITDLASRMSERIHLTSDGLPKYKDAVEKAFGANVDFSMLVKQYDELETRKTYKGALRKNITGSVETKEISTSYIERQNLTVRQSCRRFARKTSAHSRKLENHCHAVALHFMYYNFVRIHGTLRITPAMAAGVTDTLWSLEDLASLAP